MKWFATALAALIALVIGFIAYQSWWTNPRVIRELREQPNGDRAKRVMLLTLPSGKAIPVNFLREGQTVYAAADFPWWRELRGGGGRASVLIQGEEFYGHVRAVEDDPALRAAVFAKLRPNAIRWAGTLVVVELD